MRVILCGYNWSGCKALEILVSKGHEVFVYTHDNPSHITSLVNLCKKKNIDYSTENISKSTLPFTPDVVCSIYYRYIIKKHIIDLCDGRIFNLHPSLLPKYRGCSSITWAMINGESETGFTYHYIDEGCDTGPILLQRSIKIEEWDTQQTVYLRTMFESMNHFEEVVHMVANHQRGVAQTGEASHYLRGCPHNGQIDPQWNIEQVERFIRAMNYPPYAPAQLDGNDIRTLDEYVELTSTNKP